MGFEVRGRASDCNEQIGNLKPCYDMEPCANC